MKNCKEAKWKSLCAALLALCLLCVLIVGGTLAYLTDTDYHVNIMTVGNVRIEQLVQYRDNGSLVQWDDDYTPGLYAVEQEKEKSLAVTTTNINGESYELYNTDQNVVDKIVSVRNTGSEAAYVRTVFAFEMKKIVADGETTWENPIGSDVILNVNGSIVFDETDIIYKDQYGKFGDEPAGAVAAYVVAVYTYKDPLSKNTTSAPSLLQVYLSGSASDAFYETIGEDGYEIRILSQAVQVGSFENANDALNAAFGAVNADNAANWFEGA